MPFVKGKTGTADTDKVYTPRGYSEGDYWQI